MLAPHMSDWGNSDSWSLELLEAPRLFLYLSVSLHMCLLQQLWEAGHFMTWFRALKAHVLGEREREPGRSRRLPFTALTQRSCRVTSTPPHLSRQSQRQPPSKFKGRGHRLRLLVRSVARFWRCMWDLKIGSQRVLKDAFYHKR